MTSDIKSSIDELNGVTLEIRRLYKDIDSLKKRKEQLEDQIQVFLEETKKIGVKSNDISVILEEKKKIIRKKKDEKMNDCINILNHYNIGNAPKIYSELIMAFKGNEERIKKIKITDKRK